MSALFLYRSPIDDLPRAEHMPPGKGRREDAIERRKVMSTHPAFCSHPGGIPEVRWHCVQHTEPDQDALHGFVCLPDSWTQVPQVFQVPQHSTRAVMAACVSILSLLMSFLFFAQLRAAVKSAVFGIGHSHRGRLDAVSQKLFVQSLRQILLQLCRKNGHLTIFSNAIWRKSKICVKCIDFKIFGSHLPKAGMLAGFLSSRHRDACDACDDFCRPLLVFFVKFRRSAIRRSRRGLLRLLSLSLGRSVMFI